MTRKALPPDVLKKLEERYYVLASNNFKLTWVKNWNKDEPRELDRCITIDVELNKVENWKKD